jgi:hypothetical protein
MKATRILFISGVLLLLAVFVVGIYIVPKLQSGSPATARQSDASRVSLSDVFWMPPTPLPNSSSA